MQYHILEPGDATRYTVAYDVVQRPNEPPQLLFAFGVGNRVGEWTIMPLGGSHIPVDFDYFASFFKEKHHHTLQVAFAVFSHIYKNPIHPDDVYDRIAKFKPGWLDALPTINDVRYDRKPNQEIHHVRWIGIHEGGSK